MRALVLLFAAGCAFDSHSIPGNIDPIDADITVPPPPEPDADVPDPPEPEPDAELPRADFGEPCTAGTDCEGGICHEFGEEGWLCTQPCATDEDCPDDRECAGGGYCEVREDWGGGGGGGGGG